ncbi:MAG: dTDP-glucose 4,6-dehydratase [Nanoarchaeota archaeon]|nr:dTDP-glucose 4,6-dehydratase [DPANN group archaeon]MBL7116995.1 dTDP-glucose 4,6-dehydratase [Nanoarchaeota archaeon]
MRILVTGGCGFIGSNFIRHMLRKYPDYEIINLDKLTYAGNPDNLRDVENNKNYEFIRGDICDSKIVGKIVLKVDAIINFAAESHVDNSIRSSREFIQTNVLGTLNLLEFARVNKIKKFLQISTDEVYGSIDKGSFSEDSLVKPSSPYSASKASAELLVMSYVVTHRFPAIISRSSNNYGPCQYPEKIIPLFITNLLEGKKIPLYGDGKNVRDWIHVQDNCEAIDFIFHNGKIGEIYNIGGGTEKENIEVAKFLLGEFDKSESFIEFVEDRKGHDRRYALNCEKLRKLGWKPKVNFDKGLKETVKWYVKNKDWWKRLKK